MLEDAKVADNTKMVNNIWEEKIIWEIGTSIKEEHHDAMLVVDDNIMWFITKYIYLRLQLALLQFRKGMGAR